MRETRLASLLGDLERRLALEVAGPFGMGSKEPSLEALVALVQESGERDCGGIDRSKAAITVG